MSKTTNTKYAYLAYIISPFFTVLLFAKNYRSKLFINIVWMFFAFLGYILVTNNESGDSYRYTKMFEEYASLSTSAQLNYFGDAAKLDLFRPVAFKLVSLLTANSKIFFAFVAFFFGFFYSRILWILFTNIHSKLNLLGGIILINFIFLLNFYGFQFVRFNTANVVFIYFVLKFYLDGGKRKYLFLSSSSILIHFTFIFPVVMLFAFQFLPKLHKLYLYAFLVTALITVVDFGVLANFIEIYLPQELESRKAYLDENYKEQITESFLAANWYIRIRGPLLKYTFLILLIQIFIRNIKHIQFDNKKMELISFLLFFGVFANIVAIVPSGNRFLSVSNSMLWIIILSTVINNYKLLVQRSILKHFYAFAFIFNFIIGIRYIFDVFPIEFFLGNPLTILFGITDVELIFFVKQFL